MKFFLSEFRHDYSTYTFGYAIYGLYTELSDLAELYPNGFLPYTGNIELKHDVFYKSRGIRVALDRYKDGSENRRVARKAGPLHIEHKMIPIHAFTDWERFYSFSIEYSAERIGGDKMPIKRLEYIMQRKYLSHIIQFTSQSKTIAYILAILQGDSFHYWFCFYDVSYLEQGIPLGKWMMWKGIHLAKELGCRYCYLGNSYTESALYKSRDFNAVEFFDGNHWIADMDTLQSLCIQDAQPTTLDLFKQNSDPDQWLEVYPLLQTK
jgi:leucyl-tRNA---protein transferase